MTRRRRTPNDPTAKRAMQSDGDLLYRELKTLPPQEAELLIMRWGLTNGQPQTWDELGRKYGVSRERIRQIEQQAMAKLRHPTRRRPLLVTDDDAFSYVGFIDVPRVHRTLTRDELEGLGFVWCAHCHERPFLPYTAGRRRAYCSNKCRQAAYRQRRRRPGAPDGYTDQAGELAG